MTNVLPVMHDGGMNTTKDEATRAEMCQGFCYLCGQHPDDMGRGFRESVHGGGHHRPPRPLDLRATLLEEHRAELDRIAEALGIDVEYSTLGGGFALLQALNGEGFRAGLRATR